MKKQCDCCGFRFRSLREAVDKMLEVVISGKEFTLCPICQGMPINDLLSKLASKGLAIDWESRIGNASKESGEEIGRKQKRSTRKKSD